MHRLLIAGYITLGLMGLALAACDSPAMPTPTATAIPAVQPTASSTSGLIATATPDAASSSDADSDPYSVAYADEHPYSCSDSDPHSVAHADVHSYSCPNSHAHADRRHWRWALDSRPRYPARTLLCPYRGRHRKPMSLGTEQ